MGKTTDAGAVYMDNLNKRLGDITFANGESGIWVRTRTDRVGEDKEYKLSNNMVQVGYDKKMEKENKTMYTGVAFDYSRGDMKFKNLNGSSDIDKYGITLYDTMVMENGLYTDYTLRAGRIESDFTVYGRKTGKKVKGDYDTFYAGAGVEVGQRFEKDKFYLEPQGQVQYTFIDGDRYTTNQGTKVDLDDIHSLIGRVGVRVGRDFYKGAKKDNTIYLKTDINREFLGAQELVAKDKTGKIRERYENHETWLDFGVGGAKNITESLYIYGDIEKQFGKSRDSKSWQGNLGFRYSF